jgi:pimeloyl-ACP methyl ester carboxylesterase
MKELHHKIIGEGDPVVIIHGLFGMSDNWGSFAKKLAESHMVILVDVRNHGRSPHTDTFTYREAADDIIRLLENNWIYKASFIGHSMGGKIAMQLAADHPDFVINLVVVDIAPVQYKGGHETIIEALTAVDVGRAGSRKEVEEKLVQKLDDINIVRFLLKNLSREKGGGFRWKMNLELLAGAYETILDEAELSVIDKPTLFIKGENSDYINELGIKKIKTLFTQYQLEEIPESGHWIHADQPEKLYDSIIAFLGGE